MGFVKTQTFLKIRDLTSLGERYFAKIFARDAVLGKKMVFGIEITEFQDAGLS